MCEETTTYTSPRRQASISDATGPVMAMAPEARTFVSKTARITPAGAQSLPVPLARCGFVSLPHFPDDRDDVALDFLRRHIFESFTHSVDHREAVFALCCHFGAYLGDGLSRLALDLLGRNAPKRLPHGLEYPTVGALLI
jgi:hypothetical protein